MAALVILTHTSFRKITNDQFVKNIYLFLKFNIHVYETFKARMPL